MRLRALLCRPFKTFHFYLGRSPITTRPLWKISVFSTTLKTLFIFNLSRSFITTRPLWKISVFSTTLKTLFIFNLGRSPITTRPLWKISAFFATLKNLRNLQNLLSGQVAHYKKTTLKNLCIFHHFENSFHFPPGQVAHYNKTTLQNLCIFHLFEKSLYFSSFWKNLGRSPITTRPLWNFSVFFTILKKISKNLCV